MACSETEFPPEPQAARATTTIASAHAMENVRIAPEPPLRSGSDGQPVRDDVHIPARIRLVPTRPKIRAGGVRAYGARWRLSGGLAQYRRTWSGRSESTRLNSSHV